MLFAYTSSNIQFFFIIIIILNLWCETVRYRMFESFIELHSLAAVYVGLEQTLPFPFGKEFRLVNILRHFIVWTLFPPGAFFLWYLFSTNGICVLPLLYLSL